MYIQHSKQITPNNISYHRSSAPVVVDTAPSHLASISLLTQSINQQTDSERGNERGNKKTPLKDLTADSSFRNQANSLPFSIPPKETTTGEDSLWKDDCDLDENFFSLKNKKRERHTVSHVTSRRRTLSPTTSRNMLLDALDADSLLADVHEADLTNEPTTAEETPSLAVSALSSAPREVIPPVTVSSTDTMELVSSITLNEMESSPALVTASVSASLSENIPSKRIKEALTAPRGEPGVFKGEALKRYKLRQEIARWKYSWEIASNDAAQAALRYLSLTRSDTTFS
jgi:hypothetical protein